MGSNLAASSRAQTNLTTSDLVRIVTELTEDIARFDSIISSERRELERHSSDLAAGNEGQLRLEADTIHRSAAAILERARRALAELRTLSES